MDYRSFSRLEELASERDRPIWEIIIEAEMQESELEREEIMKKMRERLEVMREAVERGLENDFESVGGLRGGDADRLSRSDEFLGSDLTRKTAEAALATAEVNAGMGRIVAGPTAGASGIVPAVVLSLAGEKNLSEEIQIRGLLTAGGLGSIVASEATLSGAAGGCQAECGVGSAMAAGAAVAMLEGSTEQIFNAFALALKNLLGLVCDPVAGLVEVPCVKRNAFAATHALTAASLALAGVESVIPADEVVEAMAQIGDMLPCSLKETAEAGLADTDTGRELEENIRDRQQQQQ